MLNWPGIFLVLYWLMRALCWGTRHINWCQYISSPPTLCAIQVDLCRCYMYDQEGRPRGFCATLSKNEHYSHVEESFPRENHQCSAWGGEGEFNPNTYVNPFPSTNPIANSPHYWGTSIRSLCANTSDHLNWGQVQGCTSDHSEWGHVPTSLNKLRTDPKRTVTDS
jgi:hypothetical protein